MNDILVINNLSKTYLTPQGEIHALDNISLNIKEGEIIAIVGPSGCGKSTLLSILCGLENKNKGTYIFPNKDKIKIGYMLQQDTLFPWLNIIDNCMIGLKIENKKSKKDNVLKLLKNYGLSEFINNYPKNLSGGMRQRVALIRTLAINPDILLMDEPFSALDYQTRLAVSDDVYKIIKKENKTVIIVTHDLAEAISMADRIIIMSSRPAKVKKIINVDLTNKTTPINNRKCPEFPTYCELIWKELDYHV